MTTFAVADLAVAIQHVADLDEHHVWAWVPIVRQDGRADVQMLATVLDTDHLVDGEHGWVLLYDVAHPLLAVTESGRLHFGGSSNQLPEDPWAALGQVLFILDAGRHAIV